MIIIGQAKKGAKRFGGSCVGKDESVIFTVIFSYFLSHLTISILLIYLAVINRKSLAGITA